MYWRRHLDMSTPGKFLMFLLLLGFQISQFVLSSWCYQLVALNSIVCLS